MRVLNVDAIIPGVATTLPPPDMLNIGMGRTWRRKPLEEGKEEEVYRCRRRWKRQILKGLT
jgi:hypothetical protein